MIRKDDMEYAQKKRGDFYIDETRDEFGPHVRWKINDRVPFDDMLECFEALGWINSQERANSNQARSVDTAKLLADYRANYKGLSDEELFEARAAFGEGATVVNVITGHRYTV